MYIHTQTVLFGIKGDVTLNRNPGPEYNTLLVRLILGDLYSSCPNIHYPAFCIVGLLC